jgi:hypothetical protein
MWPTPNAAKAANDTSLTCSGDGRSQPNKLGWAVAEHEQRMWPTPTVQDGKNNGGPSQWERNSDPLNVAVQRVGMWPTPRASEQEARTMGRTPSQEAGTHGKYLSAEACETARDTGAYQPGQKLNPDFVERLMGFPDGWTILSESSDGDGSTACR